MAGSLRGSDTTSLIVRQCDWEQDPAKRRSIVKPEPKRLTRRRRTHCKSWIDASLSLHPVQGSQSHVLDLTLRVRTTPPMELVVPLTWQNLESVGVLAFWVFGFLGFVETISQI